MKIGLIGCGVIGQRRVQNLPPNAKLTSVFDTDTAKAKQIADAHGATIATSAEDMLSTGQVDGVIVAAINSVLVPTMKLAKKYKVPVLVEKPAARSYSELKSLDPSQGDIIKIGFNHRFHPAYLDILKELKNNPNDPIMYIRANYGNGSRLGFEKEWRANVELSGGGELLDQGVHLLDLATNILPELEVKTAWVRTHYWDMNVDDSAWATLSTPQGQTFSMHVSSCEWKNEFRFEVYTRNRKYQWVGLGRSYGPETLNIYKMKPEMGPPDIEERKYPNEDHSWLNENQNFLKAIKNEEAIFGGFKDAVRCLKHVENMYKISKQTQKDEKFKHPIWWQS
ncbi:MAG: oxidoreductase [Oligoflexia bacterium]|nr:MAG: oxidoreductase [Oligoflexia bacterium]